MVHGRLESGGVDVGGEGLKRAEEVYPQAHAATVVLGDEGDRQVVRCLFQRLWTTSHGNRVWRPQPGLSEGRVLPDFADFQRKGPTPIDDAAPMTLQPHEQLPRIVDALTMPAGVRGRTHAVEKDPSGRLLAQRKMAGVDVPFFVGYLGALQLASQWRHPVRVFIQDVHFHGSSSLDDRSVWNHLSRHGSMGGQRKAKPTPWQEGVGSKAIQCGST